MVEVPKASKGDAFHALAKAGLSVIPVIGGPAVELFQHVVQPPLEKRRNEWMQQVGEALRDLEERGVNLEDLQNNEEFITAVMQASASAIQTHKQEKLRSLKNAIMHIAVGQGPEEAMQAILFSLIDSLTELHFRILAFASSPNPPGHINSGSLGNLLEHRIPELKGRRVIYDQFWRDLHIRGLVTSESLHGMMTAGGLAEGRVTELGKLLLDFISEI